MVTPENGTAVFQDLVNPGTLYSVDAYFSDVAGAAVTFNQGGAAGATSDAKIRFKNPVRLVKLNVHTGQTVAVGLAMYSNGQLINGSAIRYTAILDTIQPAPTFNIGFAAGADIVFKQF